MANREPTAETDHGVEGALRSWFELTTDLALACRLNDGAVVDASDALCARLGWDRAALTRAHAAPALWDDATVRDECLRALREGGRVVDRPARLRARDGAAVDVSLGARCVRAGATRLALFVAPDATERRRVERDLRASSLALEGATHELNVTLRTIGDGVILTDGWGRVLTLNPVAEHLTKWSAADARGRPLRDVFHVSRGARSGDAADPFSDVINRRHDAASWPRAVLVARDGSRRDIAESVSALRRADGEGFGVVVVFRDITAQCRLEAELHKNQRLEALGVLAGGIAHDINNILIGVLGNLGIARERTIDDPLVARLDGAERATVRARGLMRQLMTLAKGSEPVRTSSRIATVVGEAAQFALSGSRSKCRVVVDDEASTFDVDPDQIGRVIQNIVLNADQAMPDGGVVEIRVSRVEGGSLPSPARGGWLRIAIRDEGPGVPPDVRARMFEPYFTTKATGSGLGLAVAQSIVAQHGGWLDVDSRDGGGATFFVYLPAAVTEPASRASDEPSGARGVRHARVLLLEDDDAVAEIARGMLEELECTVVHAESGEQAAAAFVRARDAADAAHGRSGEPFDVVLLDLTVRGAVGGRACLERLRALGCRARAILASGYPESGAFARGREDGFDATLAKPYSLDELRAALDAVLDAPGFLRPLRASVRPPSASG